MPTVKRERFEAARRHLHDGPDRTGWVKRHDKVVERVGRLRERHAIVDHRHDLDVERGPDRAACAIGRTAGVPWAPCRLSRKQRTPSVPDARFSRRHNDVLCRIGLSET